MSSYQSTLNIICLETEAFKALLKEVTDTIKKELKVQEEWIGEKEVMKILGVTAKSTIQILRDEGSIRYSQHRKKIIRYDRKSVMDYLDKHAKDTF